MRPEIIVNKAGHLKKQSPYIIHFAGLPEGVHTYSFEMDKAFFAGFNDNVIEDASLKADAALNKQRNLMLIDFTITGHVVLQCDLCSDNFNYPVEIKKHIIVKPSSTNPEDADEDEIIISENDSELNVAQHLYDFIEISLPMKHVHPVDKKGKSTCNQKTLKEIVKHLIHTEHPADPRWDVLKNINLN